MADEHRAFPMQISVLNSDLVLQAETRDGTLTLVLGQQAVSNAPRGRRGALVARQRRGAPAHPPLGDARPPAPSVVRYGAAAPGIGGGRFALASSFPDARGDGDRWSCHRWRHGGIFRVRPAPRARSRAVPYRRSRAQLALPYRPARAPRALHGGDARGAPPPRRHPPIRSSAQALSFDAMRWRQIGPTRAGRARAVTGVPSQPNVAYAGFDNGGDLALHRLRRQLGPALRRPADHLDRRDRRLAVQSRHHLRGERRGDHPPRPVDRRRDVQVDRCREDVDAPRPARNADDRRGRGRPAQSRPPLRCSSRTSVRSQSRARRLPLHRRRADVREGAVQGRVHERQRGDCSTRRIPTPSTPHSGSSRRASSRGGASAMPGWGSSSRPMAARPGRS